MPPPTAHVLSFGCQMNDHDSEVLSERLVQLGFGFSEEWRAADLVVFNTCSVRDNAARRVFGLLGHLKSVKQRHPAKVVAVHGCLAAHEPERVRAEAPFVDIVVSTNELDDLVGEIGRAFPDLREATGEVRPAPGAEPFPDETPFRRYLPVMRGCDFFCSFCVVPHVRGRERSFAPEEILAHLGRFWDRGVREVTLLGQNVNTYRHGELDFPGLLERVAAAFPELKLRFTTSNPWDFSRRLVEVMPAHENLAKHLHLPLQSGSSRVLEAMRRTYTAEEYLRMVEELREVAPDMALTTDLMAGFPGETDADHAATLALMDRVRFDNAFMFYFQERTGTPAASFEGRLPTEVRKARLREIIDLQIEHSRERNRRYLGRVEPALVEGPARKSPGKVAARLDHNKTVLFEAELGPLRGLYVPVEITATDAFTLEGRAAGEPLPGPASRERAAPGDDPSAPLAV